MLNKKSIHYRSIHHIFEFLKKKRGAYFSTKNTMLAGIETLLYQEIKPGIVFIGLIDLVFYNKYLDRWTIIDIKTSTSGEVLPYFSEAQPVRESLNNLALSFCFLDPNIFSVKAFKLLKANNIIIIYLILFII